MSGIFELEDVTFTHNPNIPPVMDGFNLSIKEGSHTAILGANGAGKTTLFYTLTGVYKPQKGQVLYKGEPLEYTPKGLQRIRSEAAVVPAGNLRRNCSTLSPCGAFPSSKTILPRYSPSTKTPSAFSK